MKWYIERSRGYPAGYGYTGPLSHRQAMREQDAWDESGWPAVMLPSTPEVREDVRERQHEADHRHARCTCKAGTARWGDWLTARKAFVMTSTRIRLRRCVLHPGYTMHASRRHRHPDGGPEFYERCIRCRRVTWRAWDREPFNQPRWRAVLTRARARRQWRRRAGKTGLS